MPPLRTAQRAYMTLPALTTTPFYQPVRIIEVTATLVRADNGRTFRRDDLTATDKTEADLRAGGFTSRLIPDTHPGYRAARDQHIANLLRVKVNTRIRGWQRHPASPTTARNAASALEELADHLDHKEQ